MASASAINVAVQREMHRKDVVRAREGITLVMSNEDVDDIIKIINSLEKSGVLIDGVSEEVKHEIKKQKGGFLGILLGTLGASMVGNV